jgi:hypothetical protein
MPRWPGRDTVSPAFVGEHEISKKRGWLGALEGLNTNTNINININISLYRAAGSS